MKANFKRLLGVEVASGAFVAGGLMMAAPAHAGGGGDVSGRTDAVCAAELDAAIDEARARGYRVYNINRCSRALDGYWYGGYSMTGG
ncbi:hypothetical protein [Microlunatus sp. GCM10028923]|uniref:hypothetical protein n=1 Tax=Microlunatus sp. GCM10028923 TaxID=3273400 RepID=UPI003606B853